MLCQLVKRIRGFISDFHLKKYIKEGEDTSVEQLNELVPKILKKYKKKANQQYDSIQKKNDKLVK